MGQPPRPGPDGFPLRFITKATNADLTGNKVTATDRPGNRTTGEVKRWLPISFYSLRGR